MPLTPRDIEDRSRAGSAAEKVLQLWFFAQMGSVQNLVDVYAQRVRSTVGELDIANAYAQQRATIIRQLPEVTGTQRTRRGTLVSVTVRSHDAPPVYDSFLLTRAHGRWRILYDTLLDRSLAAYIESQEQARSGARKPTTAAVKAGADASRRLRALALRETSSNEKQPARQTRNGSSGQ